MANGLLGQIAAGPNILGNIAAGQGLAQNTMQIKQQKQALQTGQMQQNLLSQKEQILAQEIFKGSNANELQDSAVNIVVGMGLDGIEQQRFVQNWANNLQDGSKFKLFAQSIANEADQTKRLAGLKQMTNLLERTGVIKPDTGTGTGATPAEIQSFEFLTEGLSESEKAEAKRIKLGLRPRAAESAQSAAEKAFAKKAAELQARVGLEPQVAYAVTAAKNEAKVLSDEAQKNKSNTAAWNVYNKAMGNLSKSMGGTATGPIVGFIPAVTENQQIAEGAVAVMAPVLKEMFRAAGEGVFTDQDQKLLMRMVPVRTDHPAARVAKIQAIDTVVRAKLGITSDAGGQATAPIMKHQQFGDITEDDIATTMRNNNMTREQVLQKLGVQ